MAMGHYYECPFCGDDYKDMKCVNEKCSSKKDLIKMRLEDDVMYFEKRVETLITQLNNAKVHLESAKRARAVFTTHRNVHE